MQFRAGAIAGVKQTHIPQAVEVDFVDGKALGLIEGFSVKGDAEIGEIIRECKRLPECVYTATGVRMADSPMRRIAMKTHGAINHNAKRFYPVFDWVKADLLREFDASGVRLPVDYKLFGRTFDGIDYRFLKPIKENFPRDYEKIITWFPLAELELFRRGE